ncbi:hypothetical protein FRC17_005789, partial [Serendipita sp. 399]
VRRWSSGLPWTQVFRGRIGRNADSPPSQLLGSPLAHVTRRKRRRRPRSTKVLQSERSHYPHPCGCTPHLPKTCSRL